MDNEEMELEKAASVAPKEDEIRAKVIEDFGFDAEADSERIDKMVAKEVEGHSKLSKAIAQKIKHRTEAEEAKKQIPPVVVPSNEPEVSPKDYLALTEAKVTSEDFDEVVRVSKILGKPVSEALKDTTLKTILSVRASERESALATQTKSARGASSASGESILQKAKQGELPDEKDMDKLVAASIDSLVKK